MPYNPNIPQPNDFQDQSQSEILDNFTALLPWGLGYGVFSLQAGDPSASLTTNEIYTKLYATTTKNELFIQKQSNNAPTIVPFTASRMSNDTMLNSVNGWSYLPSGLLIKWGRATLASANTLLAVNVSSISQGPAFTMAFQVIVSAFGTGATPRYATWSASTLNATTGNFNATISDASGTAGVSYIVIGV